MSAPAIHRSVPHFEVTARKFEITEMCEMFLGRRAKLAYVAMLCVYMYSALWAYTAVFANSFSSFFGLGVGDGAYTLWALMFGAVVTVLASFDLREQAGLQVTMSAARVLVILLMVSTVLGAMAAPDDAHFKKVEAGGEHYASLLRPHGLAYFVPLAVYAQLCHHSVPVLAQPVRNKRSLRGVFACAFGVTCSFYLAIGVLLAIYMGPQVDAQCNVNWEGYMGPDVGTGGGTANATALAAHGPRHHHRAPAWAQAVGYGVVLFPAIDVLSAYPLSAITLGNNLMSAVFGSRVAKYEQQTRYKLPFRLLASMPPVLGALVVKDLGTILDVAGLFGFAIMFFFPLALQHASREACVDRWGRRLGEWTPVSQRWLAQRTGVMTIAGVAFVTFVVATVEVVRSLAHGG